MPKKKTRPSLTVPSSDSSEVVHVAHYEIVDGPMLDRHYQRLPQHVKDTLKRLHQESQTQPREAIPELQKLIEQYPKLPIFYNYLAAAYSRIGEDDKAEAVTRTCMQNHPDYLFARINYAEFCMTRKEYDKIPGIFDHKFDLQLLYPKQRRFHISEAANFMGLMGRYFYEIGDREMAEKYYEAIQQIAPDYPMVKRLKSKLFPNLLARLWRRLRGE